MKDMNKAVCPGCGKHCPLTNVRCKYGRNYIEKLEKKAAARPSSAEAHGHKWEKHAAPGSALHGFLSAASLAKRALRDEKLTAEAFEKALTPVELTALAALMEKIAAKIPQ